MAAPTLPGVESARRVLGLSDRNLARAVGTDEATLGAWLQGSWPTATYLQRLEALDVLVREIEETMPPDVVGDWLHRPLPAHGGATAHMMIVDGRFQPLRGTLVTLNWGLSS